MASPPAACTKCGHVFFGTAVQFSGGARPTLVGCTTTCPKCGGVANFGDGMFVEVSGQAELVNGPELTKSMIDRLRGVYREAQSNNLTSAEIVSAISEISPEIAAKITKLDLPKAFLLLLMVWMIKSVSLDISLDLNKVIDQVANLVASNKETEPAPSPILETEGPLEPRQKIAGLTSDTGISRQVRRHAERQARKGLKLG